jgi:cytochrome P450
MKTYLTTVIAAKRAAPAQDLLSDLTIAVDVGHLTEDELLDTAVLLVHAGHETTVNLIGNTVVALAATGRLRDLVDNPTRLPTLAPAAVVEGGRFDPSVRAAPYRVAMEKIVLDTVTIPAGALVLVDIQSANRDEEVFEHPDEFRLDRPTTPRPLTFGRGMHYCLGAHLAHLETTIALTELVTRFPGLRLGCAASELQRKASPIINGYEEIPVIL